jgi:hypothetical protein
MSCQLTTVLLVEFQIGLASSLRGDENPSEGKPKSGSPSIHGNDAARPEHLQFNYVELEARETPAPGEVGEAFSLDFPVYRTALSNARGASRPAPLLQEKLASDKALTLIRT